MSNPKPDSVELAKNLKAVQDYVNDCARRVHQGEIMDLKGLDNSVIKICDDISTLPPKEAQELETQLAVLIGALEDLAKSMRVQQDKMTGTGEK